MPFQSEKQRRYLWLKHPDIAQRWAHEYPKQDKLPMYADNNKNKHNDEQDGNDSKTKAAIARVFTDLRIKASGSAGVSGSFLQRIFSAETLQRFSGLAPITKKSNSILKYVEVPHSEKPVAAGDEHVMAKKEKEKTQKSQNCGKLFGFADKEQEPEAYSTAQKLASVFQRCQKFSEVAQKTSAVIRLGEEHRLRQQGIKDLNSSPTGAPPQEFNNVGLDYPKILGQIAQMKQQRAWAFQQAMMFPPAGSDKKQTAPAPVAAYPGMNSAPANQPGKQPGNQPPRMAANKPAMNSPVTNVVGTQGPLTTENGVPTIAQNLTGNNSFSKNVS